VEDGKFLTSSGVSAGTDASIRLIEVLHGKDLAHEVARLAEYTWEQEPSNDPFAVTIPASTISRRVFVHFTKKILFMAYNVGFFMGFEMHSFTRFLIQA
jgi:transcriptional regulator GlxA family with amidase domain